MKISFPRSEHSRVSAWLDLLKHRPMWTFRNGSDYAIFRPRECDFRKDHNADAWVWYVISWVYWRGNIPEDDPRIHPPPPITEGRYLRRTWKDHTGAEVSGFLLHYPYREESF